MSSPLVLSGFCIGDHDSLEFSLEGAGMLYVDRAMVLATSGDPVVPTCMSYLAAQSGQCFLGFHFLGFRLGRDGVFAHPIWAISPIANRAPERHLGGRWTSGVWVGDLAGEENSTGGSVADEVEEGPVGFDGELGFGGSRGLVSAVVEDLFMAAKGVKHASIEAHG